MFVVNGKTYKSLAELARDAGIPYNRAYKRRQRGFSDYEIFFGKPKVKKPSPSKKEITKGKIVIINNKTYPSIKAAYEYFQPKASYNTVKHRILILKWTIEEAFEVKNRSKLRKRRKKNNKKNGYIVDGVMYVSIKELHIAFKQPYYLIYNRIKNGVDCY